MATQTSASSARVASWRQAMCREEFAWSAEITRWVLSVKAAWMVSTYCGRMAYIAVNVCIRMQNGGV